MITVYVAPALADVSDNLVASGSYGMDCNGVLAAKRHSNGCVELATRHVYLVHPNLGHLIAHVSAGWQFDLPLIFRLCEQPAERRAQHHRRHGGLHSLALALASYRPSGILTIAASSSP